MCTVGMKGKTARVEVRLELLASPRADRVEDLLALPAYTAEGRPRNDSEPDSRAQSTAQRSIGSWWSTQPGLFESRVGFTAFFALFSLRFPSVLPKASSG